MFNKELELSLNGVFVWVWDKRYEFMIVEYFLFVLLENDVVWEVLLVC